MASDLTSVDPRLRIIDQLRSPHILPITVELTGPGGPSLPPDVEGAVVGAAREALRNVLRHSGRSEASVRVRLDAHGCTVTIADSGRGFRPETPASTGRHHSIAGSLASVGGSARTVSTPGHGTEVTLSWFRPHPAGLTERLAQLHAATMSAIPDRHRPHLLTAIGPVVANLYLGARYGGGSASVDASRTIAFVLALTTIAMALWLDRRPLTAPAFITTIALTNVLMGVELGLEPRGTLTNLSSWVIGLTCCTLAIIGFSAPGPLTAAAAVASTAVVACSGVASDSRLTSSLTAIILPVVITGGGWLIGAALRRAGRIADDARRAAFEAALESAKLDAAALARQHYLSNARRELVPFLAGVVDGSADLADPAVQSTAERLMLRARDDLYFPGLLDDARRQRLDEARRRGVSVELRVSESGETPSELTVSTLDLLLPQLPAGSRVTIRSTGSDGSLIAVTPALPDGAFGLESRPGVRVLRSGGELTQFEVVPPSSDPTTHSIPERPLALGH